MSSIEPSPSLIESNTGNLADLSSKSPGSAVTEAEREMDNLKLQLNFADQDEEREKKGELEIKDIFLHFKGKEDFLDIKIVKKLKDAE